jgi:hypothetical protein
MFDLLRGRCGSRLGVDCPLSLDPPAHGTRFIVVTPGARHLAVQIVAERCRARVRGGEGGPASRSISSVAVKPMTAEMPTA